MGGTLFRDLWVNNFVDLDPSSGLLDWDCSAYTYNGHQGSDALIRTFGEQLIGVPVLSALDGVVIDSHDGEDDMNTEWLGQPSNYVIIDHGDGRIVYYWHLKKWSVAVTPPDVVTAGQQIGLAASSGNSNYPHLHFETWDGPTLIEPWAGPCRPGDSHWVDQIPIDRSLYLYDFGITYEDMNNYPGIPHEFPRSGQIGLNNQRVYIWILLLNLPAGSTWQYKFQRPNGTFAYTGPVVSWGNPFYRFSWWWWWYNIPDMHTITGTWHVWLYINGSPIIIAPVEVRTEVTPDFNRAPEPISISLDPPAPTVDDAIFCRVQTSLTMDDLDYDIVRYEYVWTVNDVVVRQVTTAGHADALPRGSVGECDVVQCTVTPGDGVDTGPMESISAVADGTCPQCDGDFDGDGTVGITDFLVMLGTWGACPDPPAQCVADLDGDGTVGITDFLLLLALWGPCP
jgi:hypothetical protein